MLSEDRDPGEDVVISGMAGLFPNSNNIRDFEENLRSKVDMTSDDDRRWPSGINGLPPRFGKLNEINKFDASFFNILSNAADAMDPMARILLEKTYEAIIDAGYSPQQIKGTKTGVFLGISCIDSEFSLVTQVAPSYMTMLGNIRSLLANRISYWLDARGPSYSVDTGCSSSAHALEHAYRAIKSGMCESVIVGGSVLCLISELSVLCNQLGILSSDGRCKSFDESGDGYSRSEGAAVLFLQKRKNARRVYAHLVHAKTNCDGLKDEGLIHPSVEGQADLLNGFYEECQVHPSKLEFFEAHAAGTKVGDLVEMNAVERAILSRRREPLKVGSVKSNMGHCEPVSGLCSIIKVILSYESGYLMPNINLKEPRSDITALKEGKLEVVTEPTKWNSGLSAINNFGWGGTNSHILLDSHHKTKPVNGLPDDDIPRLVLVSGRTEEAVDVMLEDLENRPLDAEYVALFHEIHKTNIPGHPIRGFTILEKESVEKIRSIQRCSLEKRPIWFVYSGIGSQWLTMGKTLIKIPVIREFIDKCHQVLADKGVNLINIVTNPDESIFNNILNSYCGIVAIQIALTAFLRLVDIQPDGIIGHSIGEFSCAYADGSLTLEETMLLAYYRGLASDESKVIPGLMAAVGLGARDLWKLLPSNIDIACHNGPDSCTISGPHKEVLNFIRVLEQKDIFVRKVESSNIALHSRYIDEMGKRFYSSAKEILSDPKLRSEKWLSSTYPETEWQSEAFKYASAEYFTKNIVGTVFFEEVCRYVPNNAIVIEVAPHGLLQAILKRSLSKEVVNIPLTQKAHHDNTVHLLAAVGKIYEAGGMPQISKLYPPIQFPVSKGTPSISSLVRWDHSQDWYVYVDEVTSKIKEGQGTVTISLKNDEHQYLAGHIIQGRILYPASGYLVLAWETFSAMIGKPKNQVSVKMKDVQFLRFTPISESSTTEFHISIFQNTGDFQIYEKGDLVVRGKISEEDSDLAENSFSIENVDYMLTDKDFYTLKALIGGDFEGQFRSVKKSNYERTAAQIAWHNNYVPFIDCMLQAISINELEESSIPIPVFVKTLIIDPQKHDRILQKLGSENPEFTLFHCLETKEASCGGVTVINAETTTLPSNNALQKCTLEKINFVPLSHPKLFTLNHVIRAITDIIVENSETKEMKIVEIADPSLIEGNLISPIIDDAIKNLPYALGNIIVQVDDQNSLATAELKPSIQIKSQALTNDKSFDLVIVSGACRNEKTLAQYMNSILDEGFILTNKNSVEDDFLGQMGLVMCFECKWKDMNLILLRKTSGITYELLTLKVSNYHFDWVPTLQNMLQNLNSNKKLILTAENEPINGIIGLYNCIMKEYPDKNICCFFLVDDDIPSFDPDISFFKKQLKLNLRINVYKNGAWGTYCALPISEDSITFSSHKFLGMSVYGDLSTLQWFEGSLVPEKYVPSDTRKQLVSVNYTALNSRDFMIATGKLDPSSIFKNRAEKDCMIGMEFAGYLANGRCVMGIVNSKAISNFVETDEDKLMSVPDEWTLEEAVTIPVAYATIFYSFFFCSPLKRGCSILIHCGAGSLGIAAINICLHHGCEIFTTVGTSEKCKFIRSQFPSIAEDHIGNSRDCSFEKMIKTATKGEGVDFVLNSLGENEGENKLEASIRCLKPGGHFIELRKYDNIMNRNFDFELLSKGIGFHTVNLMNIIQNQDIWTKLKIMMERAIKEKVIKPLPIALFNIAEVEKAFKFMDSGDHIGKVVLKIQENSHNYGSLPSSLKCHARFYCSSENSYVLCGGIGGLGMELAGWLVNRGARKLILTSRSGVKTGYQQFVIKKWQSKGVHVTIACGDIADEVFVKKLLELASSIGPVEAIFNLAMVGTNKMFVDENVDNFADSARPKVLGTSLLDELSRKLCPELKHFVVYSSIVCLGVFSSTSHAMANSAIERLCEIRKADKLPALAIVLGPVETVGVFLKMMEQVKNPADVLKVYCTQNIESILAAHDLFLRQNDPVVLNMHLKDKNPIEEKKNQSLPETIAELLGCYRENDNLFFYSKVERSIPMTGGSQMFNVGALLTSLYANHTVQKYDRGIKQIESVDANATLRQLGMDSVVNTVLREILRKDWNIVLTLKEVANLTFSNMKELKSSSMCLYEEPHKKAIKSMGSIIQTVKTDENNNETDNYDISQYFEKPVTTHFVNANQFTIFKENETREIIVKEMMTT